MFHLCLLVEVKSFSWKKFERSWSLFAPRSGRSLVEEWHHFFAAVVRMYRGPPMRGRR